MATIEYNISASYIGEALGASSYIIYAGECGVSTNIVATATSSSLSQGITISLDSNVEKIYLVPVLDDPLSSDCLLGCGNSWSELTLSGFVPSPTPTVTPSPTPSAQVTASPTPTPSITPSTSPPPEFTTFDVDQIVSKISTDRLQVAIYAADWIRNSKAAAIASYAANGGYVPMSDSTGNNNVALTRNFTIYTEGETSIVTVNTSGTARVYWYDDPDPNEDTSYVIFDNISLPASIPNAPTNATDLKYKEV